MWPTLSILIMLINVISQIGPSLAGLALKQACSQSYAGDAEAVAVIKGLCVIEKNIPYQLYASTGK